MHRSWLLLCWGLGGLLWSVTSSAWAGGFSIYEQGARAMARGGAFVATADDPSAIFFNPAGLAFQSPRWQVYIGATVILPRAEFDGMNPFPGEGVHEELKTRLFLPPNLYITYRPHERITLGLGVFSAFGLGTAWENPETFSGRHISFDSSIQTFSIQPTVAFKVSDRLSVGGGVEFRAIKVVLNRFQEFFDPFRFRFVDISRVKLESDINWAIGFVVGVLYRVTETVRFGFSYRHHMTSDLQGTISFEFIPTGDPRLDPLLRARVPAEPLDANSPAFAFPQILIFGVGVSPWKTWDFELDITWMGWSRFERINLEIPELPEQSGFILENYDDTFAFRFGVEKQLGESWTLLVGFLFDQTPVPTTSLDPVLPDADRWGIHVGTSFQRGNWRIDVAGLLLFFRNRTVTQDDCVVSPEALAACLTRGYFGTYRNFANLLGFNVGYRF